MSPKDLAPFCYICFRKNPFQRLTYKALKCVKRKHRVYRKYRNSQHPACVRSSRKASKEVIKAKLNFEKKLAENIKILSRSLLMFVGGPRQQGR